MYPYNATDLQPEKHCASGKKISEVEQKLVVVMLTGKHSFITGGRVYKPRALSLAQHTNNNARNPLVSTSRISAVSTISPIICIFRTNT
jgi:hypothetical protein